MNPHWRMGYFLGAFKACGRVMFGLSLWVIALLWTLSHPDNAVLLASVVVGIVVVISVLSAACAEPDGEEQEDAEPS